jgi:tetratricopeptide (TPR) repeat protein
VPPDVPRDGVEPAVGAAIDAARGVVSRSPRSAAAWGHLGMVLQAHRFLDEADVCLDRAERLDPREPRWPYFRGLIRAAHDAAAAIPFWQRAVELGGDERDWPRLRLADALFGQGRSDEARRHWQALLRRDPGHPPAHLGLARLALHEGDVDDCLAHLAAAADSPFTRKAARSLAATALRRQGNAAAAEQELRRAAALPADAPWPNPYGRALLGLRRDRRARFQEAMEFLEQNRLPEGIALLEQVVADFPDFDIAWRNLGFALISRGDAARAEQVLGTSLALAPDSAEGHYYQGCAAFNQRKYPQAAACLRKATALKPDYAAAHVTLAQCLQAQGDRPGAVSALRMALLCRPNLPAAHRSLGELLIQDRQTAEAREHLRLAVELDPRDRQAKRLLDQIGK